MFFEKAQNNLPFTNTQSVAINNIPQWNAAYTYGPGDIVVDSYNAQYYSCVAVVSVMGPPAPHNDGNNNWVLQYPQPNQYITAGNACDETGQNPFSISLWVKCTHIPNTTDGGTNYIYTLVNKEFGDMIGHNGSGWELGIWHYGVYIAMGKATNWVYFPQTGTLTGGEVDYTLGAGIIDDGHWHHIVMTYDGGGTVDVNPHIYIYVDNFCNTADLSLSYNGNTNVLSAGDLSNAGDLTIGNNSPQSTESPLGPSNCIISDVSKWPITLTPAQINSIYNTGHAGDLRQLAFWSSLATSTRGFWYTFERPDLLVNGGYVYDRKDGALHHATVVSNSDGVMSMLSTDHP